MPPLLDYPNHLARATVLAFGGNDPVLSRMYASHWAIIPNLGTDLVLPPLLHVLPIHLAGRVVVGCTILLPVIGTIAYSRATFGTRSAWPLASGLVAYNATLLLGFVNFVAAIGIALLLAAAWIAWRDRASRRVMALAVIGTVALFFCHLMGLVFFYALIAGYELEWIWTHRTERAAMLARIAALVPLVAAPLGLYVLSPLALLPSETELPSLADKARQLVFSVFELRPAARHRHRLRGRRLPSRLHRQRSLPYHTEFRPGLAGWFAVSIWRLPGLSRARITSTHASRSCWAFCCSARCCLLTCRVPQCSPPSPRSPCCSPSAWQLSAFAWHGHRHDVADIARGHRRRRTRRTRLRRVGIAGGGVRTTGETVRPAGGCPMGYVPTPTCPPCC